MDSSSELLRNGDTTTVENHRRKPVRTTGVAVKGTNRQESATSGAQGEHGAGAEVGYVAHVARQYRIRAREYFWNRQNDGVHSLFARQTHGMWFVCS